MHFLLSLLQLVQFLPDEYLKLAMLYPVPGHINIFLYVRIVSEKMKKDEETLLRLNFLIQAARMYQTACPQYSSHFLHDFITISEKKIIRIDRGLKKKIDKRRFMFKSATHYSQFIPSANEERMQAEQDEAAHKRQSSR